LPCEWYGSFTAVDDVKVNGKRRWVRAADYGGLVLAYLAYLEQREVNKVDLSRRSTAEASPQRFYIGYARTTARTSAPK
jgi:hypothetical protein